jgi:hypothetical protein
VTSTTATCAPDTRAPAPTSTATANAGPHSGPDSGTTAPAVSTVERVPTTLVPGAYDGWQALAAASLGRLLNDAEVAAVEHLPVDIALDLLFPDLTDAARHEALWAFG